MPGFVDSRFELDTRYSITLGRGANVYDEADAAH